jgi:YD repeat-containing protein
VNLANGNLHLELGPGSCVTCGGSGSGEPYVSPQASQLSGPTLIYNTLGTADTALGPKWMLPWHSYLEVADETGDVTLNDADGTRRIFTKDSSEDLPQTYTGNIESAVLTDDGTNYTLTRCNGDKWVYPMKGEDHALQLVSIASRTGHSLTATFDGGGRLEKTTDSYGREIKFFYITYGSPSKTRLCEIREPAPGDVGFISTLLGYDSSGRLVSITNAVGETTRFTYDSSNRIETAIDGHGHETIYTYDSSSRVTNIEDPAGNSTAFAYTSTTTTVTNRLETDTVYEFDSNKRVTKVTDALMNEAAFEWDSTTWELIAEFGPKIPVSGTPWSRHKTIYSYGTTTATQHELHSQELRKITNSDSTGTVLSTEEWTYNAQHDILTYEDALGKVTTNTYKLDGSGASVGLVLTVENGESETIETNTYDTAGNLYRHLTREDGESNVWEFRYNQNQTNSYGIPDQTETPEGNVTNLLIDVRGRTYKITDPSGNPLQFVFDDLDRLIQTINPDGTSARTVYDCCHLVTEVDQNGHGVTYEHDVMGRRSKMTDQNGDETLFGYNAEGWRTTVTDPRGNVTTIEHDDLGREIEITLPGGWQVLMTYWEPGMLKTLKRKLGTTETTVSFEYDDLYFLKKKDFPSGTDTEFVCLANGLREKMKDASGEKRYYYDLANRLTKVEQGPQGFTVGTNHNYVLEYLWNAASQCTEKKVTLRTQPALAWGFSFTADGNLDIVTDYDGAQTKHEWLTDGRLKKLIYKFDTSNKRSTRDIFYLDTNDSHAYVTGKNKYLRKTLDKKQSGAVICSFAYELDAAGMRLSVTDKDGKYTKFGYDPRYQLKSENKWSAKVPGTRSYQYLFDYDPNGNRLSMFHNGVKVGYVYGDNNELTDAGGVAWDFDHFGNTVAMGGTSIAYDFESHALTVNASGSGTDTHEYDGDGRRMRSKLNGSTTWNHFVHDELTGNILLEYQVPVNPNAKSLYTWGIGLISSTQVAVSQKRWFHFDGLGTTVALTDFDENITDTYEFSAFGVLENSTGSSVNPFRYVGQWGYYDDGARGSQYGLVYTPQGLLSPATARALTWFGDEGGNLYAFSPPTALQGQPQSGSFSSKDMFNCTSGQRCIEKLANYSGGGRFGGTKTKCLSKHKNWAKDLIECACKYNVNPVLLMALMWVESHYGTDGGDERCANPFSYHFCERGSIKSLRLPDGSLPSFKQSACAAAKAISRDKGIKSPTWGRAKDVSSQFELFRKLCKELKLW